MITHYIIILDGLFIGRERQINTLESEANELQFQTAVSGAPPIIQRGKRRCVWTAKLCTQIPLHMGSM